MAKQEFTIKNGKISMYIITDWNDERIKIFEKKQEAFNYLKNIYIRWNGLADFKDDGYVLADIKILADNVNMSVVKKTIVVKQGDK